MAQLAIYLDEQTARRLEEEAEREGISRSAWVRRAVQARLEDRLPESFFEVLGTWEDDRDPEEILREIRDEPPERPRPPIV